MDKIIIGTALDNNLRIIAISAKGTVETARMRHETWPTATAVLGRALIGGLLMSASLQDEQKLTIRFLGDGPVGAVIVDANAEQQVRGYVQEPQVHLPPTFDGKLNVGGAVGQGNLIVSKDLSLGEPYIGQVPIQSGEIATDLAYYYAVSEQTPTVLALGVLVGRDSQVEVAGGYLIQLLPGAPDEIVPDIERRLTDFPNVTTLLKENDSPEYLLSKIFNPDEFEILEKRDVEFRCTCNRERLKDLLGTLEVSELEDMIAKEEETEMICHFCRQRYEFTPEELRLILNEKADI